MGLVLVKGCVGEGEDATCCADASTHVWLRYYVVRISRRPTRRDSIRANDGHLAELFALSAVLDHLADRLLDPDPVIFQCDDCGRLIDTSMLSYMHALCNLILPLRIRDDFLVF